MNQGNVHRVKGNSPKEGSQQSRSRALKQQFGGPGNATGAQMISSAGVGGVGSIGQVAGGGSLQNLQFGVRTIQSQKGIGNSRTNAGNSLMMTQ